MSQDKLSRTRTTAAMVAAMSSVVVRQLMTLMRMARHPRQVLPLIWNCVTAFGTTDFRPDLAHFKVPTLVIHGDKDQTVPIDFSGKAAAEGIQGAKLIVYEGGPHALAVTHSDRLNSDLLGFLRG